MREATSGSRRPGPRPPSRPSFQSRSRTASGILCSTGLPDAASCAVVRRVPRLRAPTPSQAAKGPVRRRAPRGRGTLDAASPVVAVRGFVRDAARVPAWESPAPCGRGRPRAVDHVPPPGRPDAARRRGPSSCAPASRWRSGSSRSCRCGLPARTIR